MKKVIFLGQRQIAWRALALLARPENRRHISVDIIVTDEETYDRASDVFGFKDAHFISNANRSSDQILKEIRSMGVDFLISIQHNWILSKEIIQSVRDHAFNLHNARLPHYQGYNSISHAILNGDAEYYSTIHWMTDEVDAGSIAFEEVTVIEPTDTALSLHQKTIEAAIRAFEDFLHHVRTDAPIPRRDLPTDVSPKFYGKHSLRDRLDITAIHDPAQIDLHARALFYPPHNVAYKVFRGQKTHLIPEAGVEAFRAHSLSAR